MGIPKSTWGQIFSKRMLICIVTGFTSGLPLYLLIQLIPAWLQTEGVDIKAIGLFGWTTIAYGWKFIWSPLMDWYVPPFLGRRRGWMLVSQGGLMALMFSLSLFDPQTSIWSIAGICVGIGFLSASQDVVLDAYRRELLPDEELGLGNSLFVNAYRVAGFVPGGLALILADHMPWAQVHWVVASFMLVGIVSTLLIKEPQVFGAPPTTIKEAVVAPFVEFFARRGIRAALLTLAFLFLYKLGDSMATALSTAFYLDIGFTKTVVGTTAKLSAFWAAIIGGTVGGVVMLKLGINKSLWLFGVVQISSILGFALLSEVGTNVFVLAGVIIFEYLGVGLGTAGFVAFMARETDKRFTATQFALFSSFIGVARTAASSFTGYIVDAVGWTAFFFICTVAAVPGMLLLFKVAPWNGDRGGPDEPNSELEPHPESASAPDRAYTQEAQSSRSTQ